MGSGRLGIDVQLSNEMKDKELSDRDELVSQIETNTVLSDFEKRRLLEGLSQGGSFEDIRMQFEESQKMANPEFRDGDRQMRESLLSQRPVRFLGE